MAEIGSTRNVVHKRTFNFRTCLLASSVLLLDVAYLCSLQALAEVSPPSDGSMVDHYNPCAILLAAPPNLSTEPVRTVQPMFREPLPATSAPPLAESIPRTKPETQMRVAGVPGSNQYWARVQARIRGFWTAPPADISGKALTVIVKFRLERDGRVSKVTVEKSSGNDYYDMAATRAVQSAVPLPPFPPDMTDSYFDAYFTFAVGEAAGALDVPQKVFVRYQQPTDTSLHLSQHITRRKVSTLSEKDPREDCRKHLDNIYNAIRQAPENEDGLKTLQRLSSELPPVKSLNWDSDGDLADSVERRHDDIKNRTVEIAFAIQFRQFDKLCEGKIAEWGMPARFRDEPVYSGTPETRTLGRAFCTAINGGGKAEFHVLNEKSPTVSISVRTKKRRFAVIFQKKMQADLSEAWRAMEIQTLSDRRPAYEFLGQTFMDRFPELVQNE